jgi:hypothetical protein
MDPVQDIRGRNPDFRNLSKRILMAKPNYAFEKRQKELAKKKKKEEKRLKKSEEGNIQPQDASIPSVTEGKPSTSDGM